MSKNVTKKKSIQKRLDGVEWKEAEIMWASGDWTQKAIAEKFGISGQAVYMHMRDAKIEKGSMRAQLQEEAGKQIAEKMSDEIEALMVDALESKKLTVKASLGFQRLGARIVKKAADEGRPPSSCFGDLKAINEAIKVLGTGYQNISDALGLDKLDPNEEELERLEFYDLTTTDIEEMRKAQAEELAIMNGGSDDAEPLEDIELEDDE